MLDESTDSAAGLNPLNPSINNTNAPTNSATNIPSNANSSFTSGSVSLLGKGMENKLKNKLLFLDDIKKDISRDQLSKNFFFEFFKIFFLAINHKIP